MLPQDNEKTAGGKPEHHIMMAHSQDTAEAIMDQLEDVPAKHARSFHLRSQTQLEMLRKLIPADAFDLVEEKAQAQIGDQDCPLFNHDPDLIIRHDVPQSSKAKEMPFEFFKLPPELREMILKECLLVGTVFY